MNTLESNESKVIVIFILLIVIAAPHLITLIYVHTHKKISRFFRKLKRAISWGIFMFSNEEWDPVYLNKFLDKKLADMEKSYIKYGNSIHRHSEVRLIRLARKYLKLSWNNEEVMSRLDALMEKKYGEHDIVFGINDKKYLNHKIVWGGVVNDRAEEVSNYIYDRLYKFEEKYYAKFWDIMKKHIGNMWD
jgi:hypothetical protein